jgi:predicted nucleic acid-binding protein
LFLDTNVLIDAINRNSSYHTDAVELLTAIETTNATFSICAFSLITYAYVHPKIKHAPPLYDALQALTDRCTVLPVDENIVQSSIKMKHNDFEDAIQYFAAASDKNVTHIVTSDRSFPKLKIPVISILHAISILKPSEKSKKN